MQIFGAISRFSSRFNPAHMFFGWWIVAAGFVIELLNGALIFHSFSAYLLPLQREFGWSRTLLSGAFAMARTESGLLGPLQGWLIDRYGPRPTMVIGNLLFGAGLVLFSQMDSVFTFYATFALIALGSSTGSFIPIGATIMQWFARRRSTALGISMMGMGVGGMLVPTVAWSLGAYGWRSTAFVSGVLIWVIAVPCSLAMRHRPEDYGELPDGTRATRKRQEEVDPSTRKVQRNFSPTQALKTRAFWLLSVGHGSALFVVGAVMLHQIPHMVEGLGMSEEEAARNVALLLVVFVGCQFLGGLIGDRVNKLISIFLCMWMHTAAMAVFALSETPMGAVTFAVLHGIGWGIRSPIINALRADYFGPASYATISGLASLIIMVGMTTGPLFAGFLYDHFGDYRAAFLILGGLTAVGSLAILMARKPVHPVDLN